MSAQSVFRPSPAPLCDRRNDLYETPPVATAALLKVESLRGLIWEPAAGRGAISRVLRDAGHRVIAADLVAHPDADPTITTHIDFLLERAPPPGVTMIVSNFPYKLADRFIRHGLVLVDTVIVLQPLRRLEGSKRADLIEHLHRLHDRRLAGDTYDTIDPRVAAALVAAVPAVKSWPAWEPTAGLGSLTDLLSGSGCPVLVETDIAPRHDRIGSLDLFSATSLPDGVSAIVTNAPFSRIDDFARHALRLTEKVNGHVVLLARHQWICAAGRSDLTGHPAFDACVVLRVRLLWTLTKAASPRHDFVWLIWSWCRSPGPPRLLFGLQQG